MKPLFRRVSYLGDDGQPMKSITVDVKEGGVLINKKTSGNKKHKGDLVEVVDPLACEENAVVAKDAMVSEVKALEAETGRSAKDALSMTMEERIQQDGKDSENALPTAGSLEVVLSQALLSEVRA